MMQRVLRFAPFIVPPIFFLFVYQWGIRSWFQQDDFAWLQQWLSFESWRDLPRLLFTPQAQGTIRPWSERAFFLAGYGLFGLDPRPMHALVALTQLGSLWMLASLAFRLTGSRLAAGLAPMIWVINPGLATPVSWLSTYNQVLCTFFLLASLLLFIRASERRTTAATAASFAVFVLGFGALEINVVFPALALAWCLLFAPQHWKRTLPYWAISILYAILHQAVAAKPDVGPYARHWNLEMLPTLTRYFGIVLAGGEIAGNWRLPAWAWGPPAWVAGITLVGLAAYTWRKGQRVAAFGLIWFVLTIAPALPLRDHFMTYYLAGPSLGIALAVASLLCRQSRFVTLAAILVVTIQLVFAYPVARTISWWHFDRGESFRVLTEGLQRAHELHPGKVILITGMNTWTFWGVFLDGPHKLLGIQEVYLAPGSEAAIEVHQDLGDISPFIASRRSAARDLLWRRAVVYQIEDGHLRNITSKYVRSMPLSWINSYPRFVDVGALAAAQYIGPGWYDVEDAARWMSKRGAIQLAGPDRPGERLRLAGHVPEICVQNGPLDVTVTADGIALGQARITAANLSFEFFMPAPAALAGKPLTVIEIEVSKTYREPGGPRELGLSFGQIGWVAP